MNTITLIGEEFVLKQKDSGEEFEFEIRDEEGNAVDLTGAEVSVMVANKYRCILNKTADTSNGNLIFRIEKGEIINSGMLDVEFVVKYPDGSEETFPDSGYLKMRVLPSLCNRGWCET